MEVRLPDVLVLVQHELVELAVLQFHLPICVGEFGSKGVSITNGTAFVNREAVVQHVQRLRAATVDFAVGIDESQHTPVRLSVFLAVTVIRDEGVQGGFVRGGDRLLYQHITTHHCHVQTIPHHCASTGTGDEFEGAFLQPFVHFLPENTEWRHDHIFLAALFEPHLHRSNKAALFIEELKL